MNSQPLDPNTADSTAGAAIATAGRPALSPAPKAGIRTTQFWLLAGILALVAWMVFAGKLDAGWFATLAPAAVLVYQVVRENLYRDANTHPNDALNQLLETILGHLPSPTSADATALITALQGGAPAPTQNGFTTKTQRHEEEEESAQFTVHSAQSSVSSSLGGENPPVTGGSPGDPSPLVPAAATAALCLLGLFAAALLPGCAQTPYYVSGVSGTVDTSKDGAGLTGGGVALTISPNPYYSLPSKTGLIK